MEEVDCPYCGHTQKENHEGWEQDVNYETQCQECDKYFMYNASFSINLWAFETPCLNGEKPHDWQPIHGYPKELFENKRRCSYCSEEMTIKPNHSTTT